MDTAKTLTTLTNLTNMASPGQSYSIEDIFGGLGQQYSYGNNGATTGAALSKALGVNLADLNKANAHWMGGGWTDNSSIDLSWLTQNMAGRLVAPGAPAAVTTQAQSDAYRTADIATREAQQAQTDKAGQWAVDPTSAGPWIMQNGQQVANPAYKGPAVTPYDPNASMVKPAPTGELIPGTREHQLANGIQIAPPTSTASTVKETKNSDGTSNTTTTQTQTPIEQQATEAATSQPTGYQGNSIVDYLKSIGQPSDFTSRSQLASQNGITGYRGTASQNIDLLNKVRSKPGGLGTPTTSQGQGGASQISPNAGTQSTPQVTPQVASVISTHGFSPEVIKEQANKSPFNAFVDAYSALYKDMGLPSIKSEYESLTKSYKELEDKKNEEITNINEDPWLTEGVRQKRIQSVENRYESKTSTLTTQMKNMETLYEKGQQEVQFIAGQAMEASHQQAVLDQAWSIKAMELAQKEAEAAQSKHSPAYVEWQDAVGTGYTGSFSQYQTEDANRKARAMGNGGLTPGQVNTTVNSIASAFDNEPTVKEYNTIKRNIDTYNNLGNSATDDIQRVYTFAKVADPGSAVKEGEYASIEKYSQAVLQRVGLKVERVFSATGILTPEARTAMGKTLQTSLDASKRAYDQVNSEYQRQIDDAYAGKARTITQYTPPKQTDAQVVESTLNNLGISYDQFIAKSPVGQIPVIQKSTGKPGYLTVEKFDPALYTKM